jgi:hypothetical protein
LNSLKYIAVFPEIAVAHPNIRGIGRVSGVVDYLVARTGNRDPYCDGELVSAMEPSLAVIEAKKSDTVVQKSYASQLIAQMLCIQHKENESRYCHLLNTNDASRLKRSPVGLLTDGEVTSDASNMKRSPVGLLTDGEMWRLYFLVPYTESALKADRELWEGGGELYTSPKIKVDSEDGKKELLGILSPGLN